MTELRRDSTYSTAEICQAMELSRSGFYAHQQKPSRPRRQQDQLLAAEVRAAFAHSRHTYGSPRLRHELRARGHSCGRRRIARLMRQEGLRPVQKRLFVPRTTNSSQTRTPAPHRLLATPAPSAPQQVWVTDITYLPTQEGWLYLAAEIDLYSRRVLGWATAEHMETTLVLQALQRAVAQAPGRLTTLIHHSDQGAQYASQSFREALQHLGISQSMSRRGNCYDNATAESFWATLKAECFQHQIPATRAQAKAMIFDYIETFYNPVRRHSSLNFLSPLEFEKLHAKN